jgi:RepB DNA-primase from phage plasmid
VPIDRVAPLTFLRTAFHEDDWIAVFLKSYQSGRIAQRVRPVEQVQSAKFQAWLRAENAAGANVYVSVNSVAPLQRSRRRKAVREIRHVFLDADDAAADVLDAIQDATELPNPSYVLRSSPGRAHIFWRVSRFTCDTVEALEKHLARKLGTDLAATACTQLTRLPGFVNYKRATPSLVAIDYRDVDRVYEPADFPTPPPLTTPAPTPVKRTGTNAVDRARHYVAAIPPAVSGQHGDVHTFRVCCRVVRGFALADDEALEVLRAWNSRCEPPWSDRELIDKLSRARRYGREPIGCLLEERP